MAMSAYLNIPDPRYEISAEEAEKLPATPNNTFLCTACGSPVTLVPHGERHTAYFRGTHHHPDCILARLRLGLSQELSNEEREYLRKNLDLKTTLFDLAHLRFEGGANGGAGNNAQNGRPRISVKKKYAFLRESPIHLSIDFTHHVYDLLYDNRSASIERSKALDPIMFVEMSKTLKFFNNDRLEMTFQLRKMPDSPLRFILNFMPPVPYYPPNADQRYQQELDHAKEIFFDVKDTIFKYGKKYSSQKKTVAIVCLGQWHWDANREAWCTRVGSKRQLLIF